VGERDRRCRQDFPLGRKPMLIGLAVHAVMCDPNLVSALANAVFQALGSNAISPRVTRVAVLRDSAIASGPAQFAAIQAATRGLELRPVDMRSAGEIERAITAFAGSSNGGLIVTGSAAATVSQSSTHGLEPPRAREGSGRSVLVLTTAPHQGDKKERTEPTAVANKLPRTVFN
jgi:hypothetical protein